MINTSILSLSKRSHISLLLLALGMSACSSLPEVKHGDFEYPKEALFKLPDRPYEILGTVRSKVNFSTIGVDEEGKKLCRNYFNKAVQQLVRHAKKAGGVAVVDVKSVTVHLDGTSNTHPGPECYDDGSEGQVLAQGIAIRWKPEKHKDPRKAAPKDAQKRRYRQ